MESGQKFFTAKNLVYLNKQIKGMYNRKCWDELDRSLPSLAREWCDWFTNFTIADDLRVLNAEFLKYMSTFFKFERTDPIGVDTDGSNVSRMDTPKYNKYAGEFMTIKDPVLEYQNTNYQQIGITRKDETQTRGIFHDMTLGSMPVYNMLNPEEHYFLKAAFDRGAKAMKRTERKTTQEKVFEDYLKDSLETGHPRKFYKINEQALDGFYKNERNYFNKYDPTGPGTVYDKVNPSPRYYTKDQTPYNVNGVNLENPKYERQYITAYAGARY